MHNLDLANDTPVYVTCDFCKEGKLESRNQPAKDFAEFHAAHGTLDVVAEAIFRSRYLAREFIDVDRPDLEPIVLGFNAPSPATNAPFGIPGNKAEALLAARNARRAFATAVIPQLLPGDQDEDEESLPECLPLATPITMRPSWDQTWLEIAFAISKRGTCSRKQVGAVVIKDNRIVESGYNGAPRGLRHCDHTNDGDMLDGHCSNAEHAERNALIFSGREAYGATLYLTCSPCLPCARIAVTAGVIRIVYAENYRPERIVDELCASASIDLQYVPLAP